MKLITTLTAAVLMSVASTATFAEEVKFPSITPTCKQDRSTCIDGYVARPDVTVSSRIGAGDFDHFIKKNGLEGMGITPQTVLPVGPLMIQS